MSNVKSTYNFVPAPKEKEVYKPEWSNQVSHDIPFSDGESGEIELKITAQTPIFIRNGHAKNLEMNDFSHYYDNEGNKQYFIPGSSLKGMIRNVLEIMSFSRMGQVDGKKFFGLRDMNNTSYKQETNQNNLKSGWLTKNGDTWEMHEVEHVRVSMLDIERKFNLRNNSIQNAANSKEKYNLLSNSTISNVTLKFKKELIKMHIKYGELYEFDINGDFKGDIVLFGNIGNKHYDFVFGIKKINTYAVDSLLVKKIEKLNDENWDFHKSNNKIPVFFKVENNKVKHFGFSKLYRLNNGHSLEELEPLASYRMVTAPQLDLASTIFGYANESNSLKGRVMISNAELLEFKGECTEQERILSTPNPSYYPFYLDQNNVNQNGYKTYVDKAATLKGFKRYPLHTNIKPGHMQKDSMSSRFIPLKEGTSFKFKIRYHNLRKAEIGALLSAITFHDTPNSFHSLGGGKSYGFGKVKLEIYNDGFELTDYLYAFEKTIEDYFKTKKLPAWSTSKTIQEIVALSQNSKDTVNVNLVYPKLELEGVSARDANEFNNVKKEKLFLKPFSELNGKISTPSTKADFEKRKTEQNKLKKDESDKFKQEARSLLEKGDLEKALEIYQNATEIFDDGTLVEFKNEIQNIISKKIEFETYQKTLSLATTEAYNKFLTDFPFSIYNEEIKSLLSKLKANSGIPERLLNMKEFEKFYKEGSQWINRLPNKQLMGSGFESVIENKIIELSKSEMQNNRSKINWQNATNHNKIAIWYGEEKAKEIINRITQQ